MAEAGSVQVTRIERRSGDLFSLRISSDIQNNRHKVLHIKFH